MKAKERLYITQDKARVTTNAREAAFLLAATGQTIPKSHQALVLAFYKPKEKPKPKPLEDEAEGKSAEPVKNRTKRVPKGLSTK